MYNDLERRKYKRKEKPYMARLRIKQYEGLEISSAEWYIKDVIKKILKRLLFEIRRRRSKLEHRLLLFNQ